MSHQHSSNQEKFNVESLGFKKFKPTTSKQYVLQSLYRIWEVAQICEESEEVQKEVELLMSIVEHHINKTPSS